MLRRDKGVPVRVVSRFLALGGPRGRGLSRAALVLAASLAVAPLARATVLPEATRAALPDELLRTTRQFLQQLRRGDSLTALALLHQLRDQQAVAGIVNLTPVAAAVLASTASGTTRADSSGARSELLDATIAIAPDLPDLRFRLADVELSQGFSHVARAMNAAGDGVRALGRYPRGLVALAANLSWYLLVALLLSVVLGTLLLLLRRGPLLAHDIGDLFPAAPTAAFSAPEVAQSRKARFIIGSGLARSLARAVVLLVLVVPLASGLGLLASAALWTTLATAYARRTEIALSLLTLAVIAMIPVLGVIARLPDAASESDGSALWACLREHCSEEEVRIATRRLIEDPGDTWGRAAAAAFELHAGPVRPASLNLAEEHLAKANPDAAGVVATMLGNVRVLKAITNCNDGTPDPHILARAITAFESVPDTRRSSETRRGSALARGLAGDRPGMEKDLQALVATTDEVDLSFIARIRTATVGRDACASPVAIARELRVPPLPDREVYLAGLDLPSIQPALPWPGVLLGRLTPRALWFHCLGCLFLMTLLVAGSRTGRLAVACPRCGQVSCSHCNVRASGFDFCPACLLEQVRPGFLDPLDLVAAQNRRDSRLRRGRVLIPLLGVLVPGTGQVLAGRPLRGALMMLGVALVLTVVVNPMAPFIDAVGFTGRPPDGLPLLPPILLAVVYSWSVVDLWVNRPR